jgi:hypothetical protein
VSWRDINKLGGSIILMRAVEVAGRPKSSPSLLSEERTSELGRSIILIEPSQVADKASSLTCLVEKVVQASSEGAVNGLN